MNDDTDDDLPHDDDDASSQLFFWALEDAKKSSKNARRQKEYRASTRRWEAMMTLLSPLLLLRANSPTTLIKSRRSLLLLRALKRDVMRFENEEKRSNDGDEFKKKCTKKVPLKRRPRVRAHTPMILLRFGTENKTEAGSCANTRAHTTIQKNTFNDAWRFFWTRNAKK
jgi:hypothetical protein